MASLFNDTIEKAYQRVVAGEKLTSEEFAKVLAAFDKTYAYSDDDRYFQKGSRDEVSIKCIVRQQPEFKEAYLAIYKS